MRSLLRAPAVRSNPQRQARQDPAEVVCKLVL